MGAQWGRSLQRQPPVILLWERNGSADCLSSTLSGSPSQSNSQHYTNGYHWSTCSALQTPTSVSQNGWNVTAVALAGKKWNACSLLRYRKVSCRKNTTLTLTLISKNKIPKDKWHFYGDLSLLPLHSTVSLFHFIVGLYRRFLPCILIRIKIPPGSHSAKAEDARAIGQRAGG